MDELNKTAVQTEEIPADEPILNEPVEEQLAEEQETPVSAIEDFLQASLL